MKVGILEVRVIITDISYPLIMSWNVAIDRLHEAVDALTQRDIVILETPDENEIDETDDELITDPVGEPG